jgi:hypothetical protein
MEKEYAALKAEEDVILLRTYILHKEKDSLLKKQSYLLGHLQKESEGDRTANTSDRSDDGRAQLIGVMPAAQLI